MCISKPERVPFCNRTETKWQFFQYLVGPLRYLPRENSILHIFILLWENCNWLYILPSFFPIFSVKTVYTKTISLFSEFICFRCSFSSWGHNIRTVTSLFWLPWQRRIFTPGRECAAAAAATLSRPERMLFSTHIASHGEGREGEICKKTKCRFSECAAFGVGHRYWRFYLPQDFF